MWEIRQKRDWAIFATDRGKRAHEFIDQEPYSHKLLPSRRADCPFCVGNEQDGTVETFRISNENGW